MRRLAFSSRASCFFLAATAEWRGTRKLRRETGWIGRESLETCQWGPRDQNKYKCAKVEISGPAQGVETTTFSTVLFFYV